MPIPGYVRRHVRSSEQGKDKMNSLKKLANEKRNDNNNLRL